MLQWCQVGQLSQQRSCTHCRVLLAETLPSPHHHPEQGRWREPVVLIRLFCAFGGSCCGLGAATVRTDAGGETFQSWTSCPAHYCLCELPLAPQSCCLTSLTREQESINAQTPWPRLGKHKATELNKSKWKANPLHHRAAPPNLGAAIRRNVCYPSCGLGSILPPASHTSYQPSTIFPTVY